MKIKKKRILHMTFFNFIKKNLIWLMYVKYCFSAIVVYFVFIVPSSVSNMITLFKWFTLVVISAKKCNILCADFGLLSQKWLVFYKIINNQYIFLILKKIIRFHSTINDKITLCALLKIHTTFFFNQYTYYAFNILIL